MKKSNLNLSYHEQDGVLLPNICISDQPEDEQPLGRYGRMALAYLRENHPERYAVLEDGRQSHENNAPSPAGRSGADGASDPANAA